MRRAASSLLWLLVVVAVLGQPRSALAANVLAQFDGLSNDDNAAIAGVALLPPDNGLAVGTNNVFQMVNVVGRVTDKFGGRISSFTLNSFFGVDAGFGESDPRVIYDAISGRWFATYVQFSTTSRLSSIILAASTTSDPTGTFCRYRLGNPTSERFIQDYPMLGVSDDKVVVSYNGYSFATNNPFLGAGIYVVNKADVLACASLRSVRMPPNLNSFAPQPAQALGSTSDAYLAMHAPATGSLTLLRISGVPGVTTVTSTSTPLAIRAWTPPPNASQAGSSVLLSTNDDRVLSVAWQNNSLWLSGNEACTPAGDTAVRSCLRVIELRTDTGSVHQDMTFGVAQQYYFYPALRPDAAGDLYVVFTSSSASDFASVRATGSRGRWCADGPLGPDGGLLQCRGGPE